MAEAAHGLRDYRRLEYSKQELGGFDKVLLLALSSAENREAGLD
jgi:hypothetical protein